MTHHWMWLVTGLSLLGVVLNIYKVRWCFAVWSVTNLAWMTYDIYLGAYAQAAMFAVYLATSIWGLARWTREGRTVRTIEQAVKDRAPETRPVIVDFTTGAVRRL